MYLPFGANGLFGVFDAIDWDNKKHPRDEHGWFVSKHTYRQARNFTQARVQARAFQGKPLTNKATKLVANISRNSLDKMLSEKAVKKSDSAALQAFVVANADYLFENAILGWSKVDRDNDSNIKNIHRFFSEIELDGMKKIVKLTVKEMSDSRTSNRIYSIEAIELNETSPAAQWVAASANLDNVDLTSIRSTGDILNLAQKIEDNNKP